MDNDSCGRPVVKSKASDIKLVKHHLDVDWPVTKHELFSELDMGYRTVHRTPRNEGQPVERLHTF